MNKKVNYKLVNIGIVLVILYLIYLLRDFGSTVFSVSMSILKPFIIGFVLAYAFYPFIKILNKRKVPSSIAIIILIALLTIFLYVTISSIIPVFTNQLSSLFNNLIKFLANMDEIFDIDLTSFKESILKSYKTLLNSFGKYATDGAITMVNTSINFISNFIISIVAFIYFLIDMENIRFTLRIFFSKYSEKVNTLIREIDGGMSNYCKGLLICILVQFIEYTSIFYVIGHPNFLLLGVLCSVSTVIPYFGGIVANVIAVITASVVSTKLLVLTLIVAFICPNIDGYVISPRVYGKTNNLSPIVSIFAVFAGGVLGGFTGILIALPTAIIIQIIYKTYKKEIMKKIDYIKK